MAPRTSRSGKGVVQLRVGVHPGPAALTRKFGDLKKDIQDFRPAFKALVPILIDEHRRIFAERGAPLAESFGGKYQIPWALLGYKYARYRKSRNCKSSAKGVAGPVDRIARNFLTGNLLAKLTSPSAAKIRNMDMRFGVSTPYARMVQFKNRRPFVGKTPRIIDAAINEMNAEMSRKVDRMATGLRMSREEVMRGVK